MMAGPPGATSLARRLWSALGGNFPTASGDWRLMGRTARLVLGRPAYATLAVVTGLTALTLAVVVAGRNVTLVRTVVLGGSLPLAARATILLELYPFVGTSFGVVQGVALYAVAALTGLNVALGTYHLREHRVTLRGGGSGAVGILLGTLGAGCAACGSAILAGLLSLAGVSVSLAWLPLHGAEVLLVAVGVLVLSTYWLADGMRGGEIRGCPVDP